MPNYFAPDSDNSRLAMLNRTQQTGSQDRAAGKSTISQETLDSVQSFIPQFEAALHDVNARLSERIQSTNTANTAVDTLKTYIRDIWEQTRRRTRRENLEPAYLRFYQLTANGRSPNLTSRDEWLNMGRSLIQGDAAAVAAGFPAVVNPSVAELQTALDTAATAVNNIAAYDRAYDDAQKSLAELRLQADDLCQRTISELRFTLYNLDPASRRRIMRTYGARYRLRPGELMNGDVPGDNVPEEGAAGMKIPEETGVLESLAVPAQSSQLVGKDVPAANGNGVYA